MKKLLLKVNILLGFLLMSMGSMAQADPTLTGVDLATNNVTVTNLGDTDINISSYWVCLGPGQYRQLSALPIVTGDYMLTENEAVTFTFSLITGENADGAGGLGLFSTNSFGSTNPSIYVDYMQWGGPNQDRSGQAVTAGIWSSAAEFVSCPSPYTTTIATNGINGGNPTAWNNADAGMISIDASATNALNVNGTTRIDGEFEVSICVDGRPDPIVVAHDTPVVGRSYGYVITDAETDIILNITFSSSIDLDGAGTGTCQIWGWNYSGLAGGGTFIGGPLQALRDADCSDISDDAITVVREEPDGGTVMIDAAATGNPNNTTSISGDGMSAVICVDGRADPLVVVHENDAPNLTFRYVVTDNSDDNNILAIFDTNAIDLDGAGIGTCRIWGWSYRGLDGSAFIGMPLQSLQDEDCSDISDEFIAVIREEPDGGTVMIDAAATGNPNNTTSISEDGMSAVICVDGRADPLVVVHENDAPNLTFRYVVTDNSDDNNILAIFDTNAIDLDGAGIGTCRIWGWSYRGLDGSAFIGMPLQSLQDEDCSDISDEFIAVIREEPDGGTVMIDAAATGNPNNTTSISEDGMSAVICVDGRADPLVVVHENDAPNLTFRYVVTDNSDDNNILAIFDTNAIDLDGAGVGTCRIWGWSYRGLDRGLDGSAFIGMPLQSLQDEDCSDISDEFIAVIREEPDGGTVMIDAAATGNPNNTTSISEDGMSAVICVDGRADPLVVVHENDAPNLTFRYVVTDNSDDNNILAIFDTNAIDLDGAGVGTCRIWGWSYRGLDGSAFIGMPLQSLQDEDCSDISDEFIAVIREEPDISDEFIAVIREEPDGGTVMIDAAATGNPNNTTSISEDGMSAVICVDGRADPLVVVHENDAPNLTFRYVVTDNSDDNNILAIFDTNAIDLDGAGVGTCRIWGWSYRGLDGSAFIGMPLQSLQDEDCSDISDEFIAVIREEPDGGTVMIDAAATGNPNNTTSISEDGMSAVICVDGRADPLVVVHEKTEELIL